MYDEDGEPIDGVGFAQEGSALRAATPDNPSMMDRAAAEEMY